jgi:protein KRI1
LPTRFKYAKVDKETFGLEGAEILLAEDAQLNSLMSIKKLAPYRSREVVDRDIAKYSKSKKKKLREFRDTLIQQIEEEDEATGHQGVTGKKIKKVMKKWIKGSKNKRSEGVAPADIVAMQSKEKRVKRKERADAFKQGTGEEEVVPEKKKAKMSEDRMNSYNIK